MQHTTKNDPNSVNGLIAQAKQEHETVMHTLDRQGGEDHEAVKCLLRAQLLMLEVLRRLAE